MTARQARQKLDEDELLDTGDVAELFGVNSKTVMRWAQAGKLSASFRTLGGHRRWTAAAIRDALAAAGLVDIRIDLSAAPGGTPDGV